MLPTSSWKMLTLLPLKLIIKSNPTKYSILQPSEPMFWFIWNEHNMILDLFLIPLPLDFNCLHHLWTWWRRKSFWLSLLCGSLGALVNFLEMYNPWIYQALIFLIWLPSSLFISVFFQFFAYAWKRLVFVSPSFSQVSLLFFYH